MALTDVHVHIDFYSNPVDIANLYEKNKIYAIFVTYLPEIFNKHYSLYRNYKYIRLALGYHPEMTGEYDFDGSVFSKLICKTRYIGEVGLNFTKANQYTKTKQLEIFNFITQPEYSRGHIFNSFKVCRKRSLKHTTKK